MYVLGLDFEATSVDPETADPIELAAVVWDTQTNEPTQIIDYLIYNPEVAVPQEVTDLTGIRKAQLVQFGVSVDWLAPHIRMMAAQCQAYVAHNGLKYDKVIFDRFFGSLGAVKLPWIDTLVDITYPEGTTSHRLAHLAADHGIFFNHKHRALFDVLAMLEIASQYDLDAMLGVARFPLVTLIAQINYTQTLWPKPVVIGGLIMCGKRPFGHASSKTSAPRLPSKRAYWAMV